MAGNIDDHPCFNKESAGKFARIHLPLIKSCNISCNYCNRNYNCPNENRPGVSSKIIKPESVISLIKGSIEKYPNLKIVGIAGPGEALAEPDITYQSFKLVRENFPDLKLCLSTNGLAIIDSLDLIKDLNIDYITVTVNTIDPKIAQKIYKMDNIDLFIQKQIRGIEELVKLNITVKLNTVIIPTIYDDPDMTGIIEIAKLAGKLGVFAQNLMPFYPVEGSDFENLKPPTPEEMQKIRFECSKYIKQISHCKRCRADAVGHL